MKLSKEEKEILESVERGEWRSVKKSRKEIERFRSIARRTLRKDKRINIRISKKDLESLQLKAVQQGLPYQTLVSSLLHKYVTGQIKESA